MPYQDSKTISVIRLAKKYAYCTEYVIYNDI